MDFKIEVKAYVKSDAIITMLKDAIEAKTGRKVLSITFELNDVSRLNYDSVLALKGANIVFVD